MLPRDSATCSWKAGGGAPSGVLPFLSRGPRKRPPNCHQTLRRPAKLYGAPPNFTLAQQTLRRTVKLYADPPNLTACHQTLRRPSKLYVVSANFMARRQTLRRASKLYGGPPNFTLARQTLRRLTKPYGDPANFTAPRQTLRRGSKLYDAAPNFTRRDPVRDKVLLEDRNRHGDLAGRALEPWIAGLRDGRRAGLPGPRGRRRHVHPPPEQVLELRGSVPLPAVRDGQSAAPGHGCRAGSGPALSAPRGGPGDRRGVERPAQTILNRLDRRPHARARRPRLRGLSVWRATPHDRRAPMSGGRARLLRPGGLAPPQCAVRPRRPAPHLDPDAGPRAEPRRRLRRPDEDPGDRRRVLSRFPLCAGLGRLPRQHRAPQPLRR